MRPNQHFYNLLQFDATSGMTQSFILSIVGGTSSTYYSYNNTVSTLQTGSIPYVNPGTWEDVAYSEQLKRSVAVAGIVGATMNSIAYSDDLINYTFANGSFSNTTHVNYIDDLGIFVIGGYDNALSKSLILTSNDGVNFTKQTTPNSTGQVYSTVWSKKDSLLVAVGFIASTGFIMTSTNGIDWTDRSTTLGATAGTWTGVAYSSTFDTYVAVDSTQGRNIIATSSNGTSWTHTTANPSGAFATSSYRKIDWSEKLNLFVATRPGILPTWPDKIVYSTNGQSWTASNSQIKNWWSVKWSPDAQRFFATEYNSKTPVWYSTDGINWINGGEAPGGTGSYIGVTFRKEIS